ncbi:MAG: GAF domain-containing sensor histidine kinase [Anaerolineales bacterium]|nr:GAF domain-containing sensor histidine kinase [Anaerolineales bacterium]
MDRDQVIECILAQLQQVVPYDTSSVQLLQDDRLVIIGGRGFPNLEELLGISFPVDGGGPKYREVVRTLAPFILDDALAVYEAFTQEPFAQMGIRSWLGVPMLVGERLVGIITLNKCQPGFYTKEHGWLAQAFASHAAIAIENARLFEETKRRATELSVLYDVATAATISVNLDEIFHHSLDALRETLKPDDIAVLLVEPETGELVIHASTGFPGRPTLVRRSIGVGIPGWVVQTGQPALLADVRGDERYHECDPDTRSELCVPLRVGQRIIGALNLESRRLSAFSEDDLRLVSTLAGNLANIIENARLYARSEELAINEERSRIAREIHDGLGQDLASLLLKVDLCLDLMDDEPGRVKAELETIRTALKRDFEELRRSIYALRPSDLERLGFLAALRKHVNEFRQQNKISVRLSVLEGESRLPPALEFTLFRVVQEALNNVRKHAGANRLWIELDLTSPRAVSLTVRDDGRGFDLAEAMVGAASRDHLGLMQMRERVEAMQGTLVIETGPDSGTTIKATLPIEV